MSKLNKDALRKMILSEMKMLGMGTLEPMGMMGAVQDPHGCDACGASPCGCDEYDDGPEMMLGAGDMSAHSHKGSVSREDCCAAVMCLVECCSCPVTKAALMECCEDIMAGHYDK